MNASRDVIVKRLESLGIVLEKIPFLKDGYWIRKSNFSVGATAEYLLGLYSIQEAAAQIPATLFTELENKTVLDACASPGGKTVQLANLMNNSGVIVALELKQRQMFALTEATKVTKNGGEIVYATCSLEPEENEFNIDWAIATLNVKIETINCHGEKGLTNVFGKKLDRSIKKCNRIWPKQTQGFFVCKLKKQE